MTCPSRWFCVGIVEINRHENRSFISLSPFFLHPPEIGKPSMFTFRDHWFFFSILTKKQQLSGLKIEVFYSAPFFFFASLLKYCTQSIFRNCSIDSEKGVKWWGKRPRGQFPKIRNGYFLWETVFIKTYSYYENSFIVFLWMNCVCILENGCMCGFLSRIRYTNEGIKFRPKLNFQKDR